MPGKNGRKLSLKGAGIYQEASERIVVTGISPHLQIPESPTLNVPLAHSSLIPNWPLPVSQ